MDRSAVSELDLHAAPSVYVATESEEDVERVRGKLWQQVALVLTGLPTAKLRPLEVVYFDRFAVREQGRVY